MYFSLVAGFSLHKVSLCCCDSVVSAVLCVTVVQGQDGWGVTYTSTKICAFKGSTVDIHCTYTYPPRINDQITAVKETYWFTKKRNKEPVDLRTDSDYTGRVQYHCAENSCTLTITDLRESDSAEYKFRFITNQDGGCFTGSPGVTVSLPSVSVSPSGQIVEGSSVNLTCSSDANPAANYTWYKENEDSPKASGQIFTITDVRAEHSGNYYCECICVYVSCLLMSPPDPPKLPSVSVSPSGQIVEGSSVNLTCSSDANPAAKYTWYKTNGNLELQPLSKESLTFSSIQSSDSGDYHCTAENELGNNTSKSISIDVTCETYLSVSVSVCCCSSGSRCSRVLHFYSVTDFLKQSIFIPKCDSVTV
uniref:B-cell receptor CD22 n=1 Tax=Lates calcarifer TaxID=8187 RepID=A0A4W6EEQ8_LATCA